MEVEKHITVSKTSRVFYSHEYRGDEKELVIVLHGYGQSARHFLRKFAPIATPQRLVIAPEGLHRFYTQGFSGRVGASWMTREDRLNDIKDYISYLDQVLSSCHSANDQPKLTILGFSQGGATAVRWMCESRFTFDRLILWAASFPHDVDFPAHAPRLRETPPELVVGNEDEFIKASQLQDLEELLNAQQIPFSLQKFDGKHDIDASTLASIFSIGMQ
ncbi:MAG: alpha/beta hydrolase [Flavobacteriales bacterium]|nr:alpha/beta hydrolase [Flavobacteriales bacterium]